MTSHVGEQPYKRGEDEPAPRAAVPWPFVENRRFTSASTTVPPVPRAGATDEPLDEPPGDGRWRGSRPSRAWALKLQRWVLLVDLLAGFAAAALAYVLRAGAERPVDRTYHYGLLIAPVAWVGVIALCRGYERRFLGGGPEELRRVLNATAVAAAGTASISYLLLAELARGYLLITCSLAGIGSALGRLLARAWLQRARGRGRCLHSTLVVGHEVTVLHLVERIRGNERGGLRVVGACVPGGRSSALDRAGVPVVGDLGDVSDVIARLPVDTLAVTSCTEMYGGALRRLAWDLEGSGVDLVVAPGLVDVAGPRVHIRPSSGLPLLHVEQPELGGVRRWVKSTMDLVVSFTVLLVLSPLLLGLAVLIRATSPGPALFRQVRVGRDGREFSMLKLRTMGVDAEQQRRALADLDVHGGDVLFKIPTDPRVTRVGRLLRRFSLDELPQLVNVLRGEMSLVGPRPPLPGEVSRYGQDVRRRLMVKPGMTGLWQVSGRSDLSWEESITLDLRYVENWSLALDLTIMWRTCLAVIRGRGAY